MLTDVGGVSQTTTFGYDSNSNVTTITDPFSHVTHQTFDALNRLTTYKNAVLNNLVTITYDAHDRPLTVTDGKGNTTSYVYDGFGEAIQQISPDSGTPCSGSTRTATSANSPPSPSPTTPTTRSTGR